jgi:hypothetical protein
MNKARWYEYSLSASIQRRKPLIIKVKSPSVRRLNGSVRRRRIGLIVIPTIPQSRARMRAVPNPLTEIPGMTYESDKKASALTIKRRSIIEFGLLTYTWSIALA